MRVCWSEKFPPSLNRVVTNEFHTDDEVTAHECDESFVESLASMLSVEILITRDDIIQILLRPLRTCLR